MQDVLIKRKLECLMNAHKKPQSGGDPAAVFVSAETVLP